MISAASTSVNKLVLNASISKDEVSAYFSLVFSECAIRNIKELILYSPQENYNSIEAINYLLSKLSSLEKLTL